MALGWPVVTQSVLSSEQRLHQIRTRLSRIAAVAEASSLCRWKPSEKAERRAILIVAQALFWSVYKSKQGMIQHVVCKYLLVYMSN
jgi:hypothetical protein